VSSLCQLFSVNQLIVGFLANFFFFLPRNEMWNWMYYCGMKCMLDPEQMMRVKSMSHVFGESISYWFPCQFFFLPRNEMWN